MVRFSTSAAILAFTMTATAIPAPLPALPDPALTGLVGNQAHGQFIGGQCINSNDCALDTACCATFGSIGLCSGLAADFQAGKTGCGFGDDDATATTPAVSTSAAAAAPAVTSASSGSDSSSSSSGNSGTVTVDPNAPGAANVGTGSGAQFITGQCLSDADCASTCCATGGACAARAVVESPQDARECGFVGTLAK